MKIPINQATWDKAAFTLAEVLIALSISALTVSGIIYGYIMTAKRSEWTGYSLAAQSLALMRMEQARAAKWDPGAWVNIDELVPANFPVKIETLDIPVNKTNIVYATNVTTITTLSTNPPLKMIRVDCSWMFIKKGPFTNTIVTYRAPDQ